MLAALAAAFLLVQAATQPPAEPTAAAAAAPSAPAPTPPPKPKLICHSEASTGSITPRRVCRTAEQAAADREQAKRDADYLREHMAACQDPRRC